MLHMFHRYQNFSLLKVGSYFEVSLRCLEILQNFIVRVESEIPLHCAFRSTTWALFNLLVHSTIRPAPVSP